MREMHALTISQHHDSNKLTEKSQIASFLCGWIFPQQVIRLVTNHRRTPGDTNEDNEYKLFGKTSLNRNWAQRRFCLVCFKARLERLQYHFGLIWFLENGQNQGTNGNIGQYWQKVPAASRPPEMRNASCLLRRRGRGVRVGGRFIIQRQRGTMRDIWPATAEQRTLIIVTEHNPTLHITSPDLACLIIAAVTKADHGSRYVL